MTAPVISSNASQQQLVRIGSVNPTLSESQNIKVAVRLRPLLEDTEKPTEEKRKKVVDKRAWTIEKVGAFDTLSQKGHARRVEGRTVFHFDEVFDEDTKTPLLYKSIARPMVQTVLNGKHATIFAYGQTGSGKTFTMQGDGKAQSGQAGIIQLVASDLFRFMRQWVASKRMFVVKVSYFEIYNEKIRDLLSDDVGTVTSFQGTPPKKGMNESSDSLNTDEPITIRANGNGEIVVNVIQNEVSNVDEVLELLIIGNAQRAVATTDINTHSSRSHVVFRLTVESREMVDPLGLSGPEVVRVSDFNLVDLAGSESVKLANTSHLRQREGASINKSLLALTTVIQSLSLPAKKRPKHINYRDSKLTRILQPHLSGNAEMAILCCVSPSKAFVEETRSSLKFAAQAKLVTMKPKVNEVLDDGATIKKLQNELADALRQIDEMKKTQVPVSPVVSYDTMGSTFCDSSTNDSLGYENMDGSPHASAGNDNQYQRYEHSSPRSSSQQIGHNGGHTDQHSVPPSFMGESRSFGTKKTRELSMDMNDIFRSKSEHTADTSIDEQKQDPARPGFQLDAVDSDLLKNAFKGHAKGGIENSADSEYFLNNVSVDSKTLAVELVRLQSQTRGGSRHHTSEPTYKFLPTPPRHEIQMPGGYDNSFRFPGKKTVHTEDESVDGPEASYGDASLKFSSQISAPDTIQGESVLAAGGMSRLGSTEYGDGFDVPRRLASDVSWDTMNVDATRPEHVGQPLHALQSLTTRDAPVPDEVTVINSIDRTGKANVCLFDQVKDAQSRIRFLERQLESSNDLVEATFRDLERARRCIHDLVNRNVELIGTIKEKRREETKEEYMAGEVIVEQYWLLKGSIYVSLFFFLSGGHEYFLASVFFVWLALETTLTA